MTETTELNVLTEAEAAKVQTLADKHDFERLYRINIDSDGNIINPRIEPFLEWSFSFLSRIPVNYEHYFNQPPNDLKSHIDSVQHVLGRLSSAGNEPLVQRGITLGGLNSLVEQTMGQTISLNGVYFLIGLQGIGEDRKSKASEALERIKKSEKAISDVLTLAEQKTQELNEMVNASREATAKTAASGRARVFHNEGLSYQTAARIWLGFTVALGAVLTFLAFGFALGKIMPMPNDLEAGKVASYLFGKLLILATLGAAVTFCAKQYTANRHNAVQNFHRSSALRTYRALLSATRDEAVHEAILHQATQAIFAPTETGYSKHGGSSDQQPLLQLFQGMTKTNTQNPAGN